MVGAVVLLVLPQVHLVLEAVEAARTAMGPVVPVFTAVGDKVGALAECLPTYLTHVGLLAGVNEGVFLHVRLLMEPFATVLAGIGPRVRMDEQVSGESGGALEHFSTHSTAERPLLVPAWRPLCIHPAGLDECCCSASTIPAYVSCQT